MQLADYSAMRLQKMEDDLFAARLAKAMVQRIEEILTEKQERFLQSLTEEEWAAYEIGGVEAVETMRNE